MYKRVAFGEKRVMIQILQMDSFRVVFQACLHVLHLNEVCFAAIAIKLRICNIVLVPVLRSGYLFTSRHVFSSSIILT